MIDPNGRWCGETHRRNRTNRHGCRASDDETSDAKDYRSGFGFHSRASLCASAICAGVIKEAMASRALTERLKFPCEAARLNHMCAWS